MYEAVMSSFKDHVRNVEWMDETTRAAALEKANIITRNIGYPDLAADPALLDEYYSEVDDSVFNCDFTRTGKSRVCVTQF